MGVIHSLTSKSLSYNNNPCFSPPGIQIKDCIQNITRRVEPSLSAQDLAAFAEHLVSPAVGVKKLGDLKRVTRMMFPSHVSISMISQATILDEFQKVTDAETAGPSSVPDPPPLDLHQRRADHLEFSYVIDWNDIPKKDLRDVLQKCKEKKKKAPHTVMTALKLCLATKLMAAWVKFRSDNPEVTRKSPGRLVYEDITKQVYNKYGSITDVVINNMWVMKGTTNFAMRLEESMENKVKYQYPVENPRKTLKAVGVVGVLVDQYQPAMSEDREVLESVRCHLLEVYKEGSIIDWDSVLNDMAQTYTLQRADAVAVAETLRAAAAEEAQKEKRRQENEDPEEGGLEDADEIQVREMVKLLEKWPFLFTYKGLKQHHQRLTARDLDARLKRFMQDHLEYLGMFLISSTKENIANLILRHKVEKRLGGTLSESVQFLMAIEMLCNHFGESLDSLILTCDKATDIDELKYTLLEDASAHAAIVAVDDDMYAANKFLVCADKTVLLKVDTAPQAFIALISACFVFDLAYPPNQPKLFEFMERFMFQMALIDSKVFRNGKQIAFVTHVVKSTCDKYEELRAMLLQTESEEE